MQAIGTLAAGARAAVTGALETLGHVTHGDTGAPVAVPAVPETGYVGAGAIAAAAGKRVEDYLARRTTKARVGRGVWHGAGRQRARARARAHRGFRARRRRAAVCARVSARARERTHVLCVRVRAQPSALPRATG
jgi:hypothetical protein